MAKVATPSVETELLEATGEPEQKEGEKRQKYLKRIATAADDLSEKDWGKLSVPAREWLNDVVKSVKDKTEAPEFPAGKKAKAAAPVEEDEETEEEETEEETDDEEAEEEEETDEDEPEDEEEDEETEDEETDEDEEEEEKPAKKKPAAKPAKKAAAEDDEEAEEPDEEEEAEDEETDEDEEEKPKPKAKAKAEVKPAVEPKEGKKFMIRTICKHPDWKRDQVKDFVASKGHKLTEDSANVIYYDVKSALVILTELGMLKDADD